MSQIIQGTTEVVTVAPVPIVPSRDLTGSLVAEQGAIAVFRAASTPKSMQSPTALPNLKAGTGLTLNNAGAIEVVYGLTGNYVSGHPGIMIGQGQVGSTGADKSHRLYHERRHAYVCGVVPASIPSSGGATLEVQHLTGFASSGTCTYAMGSGAPKVITYTGIRQADFNPGKKAQLLGCTCPTPFTPAANVAVVPTGAGRYEPYMSMTGSLDLATPLTAGKSITFALVVRPADALWKGIGGSGLGDESGTRESLCVFSSLRSGGSATNPPAGDMAYCMIDPSTTVSGAYQPYGHVRFGFGSGREVVLNDAVRIGYASIIICQYTPASPGATTGTASIWVGTRGSSDVTTASATVTGPGNIGSSASFRVGNVTLNGGATQSFHGYFGLASVLAPVTPWDTTKARFMWVASGLDTANHFGGGLGLTPDVGVDYGPVLQATAADTSLTWRGTTHQVQHAKDMGAAIGGGTSVLFNTHNFSTALREVPENQPLVAVDFLHDNGGGALFMDQVMAFQQGVPIPSDAVCALGTDSSLSIWNKSTDEYWDMFQAYPDWWNTGTPVAGTNGGGYNTGRWKCAFGAWQTNTTRLPGFLDGGYSTLTAGSGWGGSAPKLPYWKNPKGRRIADLLAGIASPSGGLGGPIYFEGSIDFTTPNWSLVSSNAAGVATASGIAAGADFRGLPTDVIKVSDSNGATQFAASGAHAGLVGGSSPITLTGTVVIPTSELDKPWVHTFNTPATGFVHLYTDSGPVRLPYTRPAGTTSLSVTGGAGQVIQAGSPFVVFVSGSSSTTLFNLLKIGTDWYSYGLLDGLTHTFKYVMNVTNPGRTNPETQPNTNDLPAQSTLTSLVHAAASAITRVGALNNVNSHMPHLQQGWVWPGNGDDGKPFAYSNIQEGRVYRIPASVDLDALTTYTSPVGSWTRAATLDNFTRMTAQAAKDHGLICMDISGSSCPMEFEDPWEFLKANGMNPYDGKVYAMQATGSVVAGTLNVSTVAGLAGSGTGQGAGSNMPTFKAYCPARGCTFYFNAFNAGPQLTSIIGDSHLGSIVNGDWITIQGVSTNVTNAAGYTAFASAPAGWRALYPSGTSVLNGVTGLFGGIQSAQLGKNFPWDKIEPVDPLDLKARVG